MKSPLPSTSERRPYGLPEALTELIDGNHPIRTISDEDLADYIQRKEKLLTNARQQLEASMRTVALQKRDVMSLEGALKQAKSEWACRFGEGLLQQGFRVAAEVVAEYMTSTDLCRLGQASSSCRRLGVDD
ncbi:hypothetical protein FOZ62_001524, partial [Perkinsus olseni]